MWRQLNVREQKWGGYFLQVLLMIGMGSLLIFQMETIVEANDKLYRHPFQVSNAAQRTKSSLWKMQLIIRNLFNEQGFDPESDTWQAMKQQEIEFNTNLNVIGERFLGSSQLVRHIRQECVELRYMQQEVVDLVRLGNLPEAIQKEQEMSRERIVRLEHLINEVVSFAEYKALFFHQEVVRAQQKALWMSVLFVMVVSLIAVAITRRQFLHFVSLDATRQMAVVTLHRTLAALSLSESRLLGIINNSNALIYLKDMLGHHLLANRRFEELFRVKGQELGSKTVFDLMPEEIAISHWQHDRLVVQQQTLIEKELVVRDGDTQRTYLSVKFPMYDENGQLLGIGAIDTDITERKRTEDALRNFHELLESLFHTSHLSIAFLDREFNFIRVNRSYAEQCALDVAFFPGKNHFVQYPHPGNEAIFRRVVETGVPFTIEADPFRLPDHPEWGVTYWDWSLLPIRGADGQVERLILTLLDVTEKIANELQLWDTNRMLRTILDAIPIQVFWKDTQSIYLGCNRSFLDVAGLDHPDQVIGRSDDDMPWANLAEEYRRVDRLVIASQEGVYRREITIVRKDGSPGWGSVTKIPLRGKDHAIVGVLGAVEDITAIKQAAEERVRLQEQTYQNDRLASMGLLAAGIAHEVNNPNNIIMVNTNLLQVMWQDAQKILDGYYHRNGDFSFGGASYSETGETVMALMYGIEENARRIKAIINNMKMLARPQQQPIMQPVDLREILNRSALFLRERIRRHTNHFDTQWESCPHMVQGNPEQLFQVFTNLILNALQSLGTPQEAVAIAMAPDPLSRGVRVEIRDTGCGIAPEHLSRLGEAFFTTRPESGGMGLGFSITKRIITVHQGTLSVHSELGQGTRVTIVFPEWNSDFTRS
ncbi:MAG: PAS domain-containing protein [Magnetococcales bacterium]|nr:PAS domain-containing protein [Magnetococcales bacterium]